jgi:hypothetical protein
MLGGDEPTDIEPDRASPTRHAFRVTYFVIGFAFAIAATVALISTDDPRWLRLAVVVAVWAFVFAMMAASRPRPDPELPTEREIELRRSYERELEREIAARREQQAGLELQLRRELEAGLYEGVRALRGELGELRGALTERWSHELPIAQTAPPEEDSARGRHYREDGDGPGVVLARRDSAELGPGSIPAALSDGAGRRRRRYRDD